MKERSVLWPKKPVLENHMSEISASLSKVPPEQQAIRDKCFHPSGTFVEFPIEDVETSIPARFEKIVQMYPDRIAVKQNSKIVTYSELNRMANRLACSLINECDGNAQPVGLLFENGISLMVAILGVLKAGKFFVLLDPAFPMVRNVAILNDSQATLLLADETNACTAGQFSDKGVRLIEFDSFDKDGPYRHFPVSLSSHSLVYLAYTSGSTGEPKGVMNNHRNVMYDVMLRTNAYHISYLDKLSLVATASVHAVNNIFFALLNGAMLLPFNVQKEGARRLGAWMSREQISICRITIQLFRELCAALTGKEEFGNLRLIQFAGDSRFNSDVDLWKKYFPSSCLLANGISSSETGYLTDYLIEHATDLNGEVMPAGYPVENKEIYLLDDNGEVLGSNQIGELTVKSSFLSPGYWQRPELTREKFEADPGNGKQIFLTGDLGLILNDGCFVYKGRKDFRTKIRGHNVELAEIENALRQHQSIKEACVVSWEGDLWGTRLVGYVVSEQAVPSVDDLRSFLKQKLAEYMIPSTFVFMETLPSTNGKLDRKALPNPDNKRPQLTTSYIPPQNDIEEQLLQIWQTTLGIHPIGIHDNFFDLGGHSLLASRILSAADNAFGVELSMRGLLDAPTVAELAEQIELLQAIGDPMRPAVTNRPHPLVASTGRGGPLPLSYSEEGLWLIEQIQPGMSAWNVQSRLRLRGSLNAEALRRSLNTLIQRHETLRTAYRLVGRETVRIISPELTVELPTTQLDSSLDTDAEITRISMEQEKETFDLGEAPLFRARLLRVKEQDHILIVTKHHMITDAWSSNVFIRELVAIYDAYSKGQPTPLAEMPVQYSDYALWIRQFGQEHMAAQLSYWREKLDGCVVQEIPTDKRRPLERNHWGGRARVQLSKENSRAVAKLCKEEQATFFMFLVTAFKILLSRYTGSKDVVVGSALAGRSRPELENLMGMFINILPLRTDLSGRPTFRELLRRVRETCLEAYQHQGMPLEKLVEELNPNRGLSRSPFFQVLFNVVNSSPPTRVVDGLTIEPMPRLDDTARFDLTLSPQTGDGIEVIAAYNRDLFFQDRIVEMLEQYKYLLEQIVDNPDQKIDQYSLVTLSARRVLPDPIITLDDTWHGSVHELIERYAQKRPDKVAVEDPSIVWSYKELNDRSNQLANYLIAQGIETEDIVAVYGRRSAILVCALLGVLKAGAAFCVIDPSHPARRVKEYLSAMDPKALVEISGEEKRLPEMEAVLTNVSSRCRIMLPDIASAEAWQFLSQYSLENPKVTTGPDHLAYVIFTSGSSGKPKGVMGRHGPLTHFLPWLSETFAISENDRFSFLSSISTNKLQREIFTALSLGATLYIPSADDIGSFGKLDEWLRIREISVIHLTPAMAQLLDDTARKSVPSVRRVFFGGDLLQMRDVDRAKKLMPRAEIVNFYNSSETQRGGGYALFSKQRMENEKHVPPLGRGIQDVQLLILNQTRKTAGIGELGEICIRSPHMARGYLGDEALTRERFIKNPYTGIEGDRIYRTGEFGRYLPDGTVEFVARGENQVSIRGFRVDLGEIESVLKSHANVLNAVVSLHENRADCLVAHLVSDRGSILSIDEIRRFLRARLPSYMIPGAFIICDSLPLTPTGKVDRRALMAVDLDKIDQEIIFVAPRSSVEELVAKIWATVLKLNRIGVNNNFFDLGGYSLLAIQIVSQIRELFDIDLPLRVVFEAPTVAEMAAVITEHQGKAFAKEELSRVLDELELMSDEEAQGLVAKEMVIKG